MEAGVAVVCESALDKEETIIASITAAEPTHGVEGVRPEEAGRTRVEVPALGLHALVAGLIVGPEGHIVVAVGEGGYPAIAGAFRAGDGRDVDVVFTGGFQRHGLHKERCAANAED